MKALVNRLFIVNGVEYRLTVGYKIQNVPQEVKDKMLKFGLAELEESDKVISKKKDVKVQAPKVEEKSQEVEDQEIRREDTDGSSN